MMPLETAARGAKISSFRNRTPRDILRELVEANPGKPKTALLDDFREEIREEDPLLDAIIEYWFANNYYSLVHGPSTRVESPAATAAATATSSPGRRTAAAVADVATKIKRQIVQAVLLDLPMPNNKALKDCTGGECAKLGPKVGAWLVRISKEVKATQKVGAALSEDRVRQLYNARGR